MGRKWFISGLQVGYSRLVTGCDRAKQSLTGAAIPAVVQTSDALEDTRKASCALPAVRSGLHVMGCGLAADVWRCSAEVRGVQQNQREDL